MRRENEDNAEKAALYEDKFKRIQNQTLLSEKIMRDREMDHGRNIEHLEARNRELES